MNVDVAVAKEMCKIIENWTPYRWWNLTWDPKVSTFYSESNPVRNPDFDHFWPKYPDFNLKWNSEVWI